jgi:hypothetical protein
VSRRPGVPPASGGCGDDERLERGGRRLGTEGEAADESASMAEADVSNGESGILEGDLDGEPDP